MSKQSVNVESMKAQYLTRDEVCQVLRISKQTLWVHTKNGTITSYRFAGRVLYKSEDIENAIVKVTN